MMGYLVHWDIGVHFKRRGNFRSFAITRVEIQVI